jgi:metabolite-proton symporter
VALASAIGTTIEWYDFFIYGTAAATVFAPRFFPQVSPVAGTLAAFATFGAGFIARPIGGIVMGHFGDRIGRKSMLVWSLMLMGLSTLGIGLLPDYGQIGLWAPALLLLSRLVQGFALGGEWGGAVLLVAEHSPNNARGFWSSWPQAAVPVGNLLATLVLYVMSSTLSPEAFLSWGWRVAFWLSAVIVFVGYYIRTHVTEAPIFLEAKALVEKEQAVSYGVFEVVRKYPKGILQAMGLRFAENIMYYLVVSFAIVYLKSVHKYDTSSLLLALLIAHFIHFLIIPQVGRLADSLGRKPVYLIGAITGAAWPFFAFPMFDTRNAVVIVLAVTIGLCLHAFMYAGQPAIMAELFPTRMRYSGVSLGSQVTSIFAGSLAPLLATQWLKDTGSWVPTAIYLVVACAITTVAVLSLKETKGIALEDVDKADAAREGLLPSASR